jgi:hypothetical protein
VKSNTGGNAVLWQYAPMHFDLTRYIIPSSRGSQIDRDGQ